MREGVTKRRGRGGGRDEEGETGEIILIGARLT
jgi:hypothetical protein